MTSHPTNFFTARLLCANRRPSTSLFPLPNDARKTIMHRSNRWLSAVSERLVDWEWFYFVVILWWIFYVSFFIDSDVIYLLPSWKRANSRAVLSRTVSAVTVTGLLARQGKQPCRRTSCQSGWILQISTESKYLHTRYTNHKWKTRTRSTDILVENLIFWPFWASIHWLSEFLKIIIIIIINNIIIK